MTAAVPAPALFPVVITAPPAVVPGAAAGAQPPLHDVGGDGHDATTPTKHYRRRMRRAKKKQQNAADGSGGQPMDSDDSAASEDASDELITSTSRYSQHLNSPRSRQPHALGAESTTNANNNGFGRDENTAVGASAGGSAGGGASPERRYWYKRLHAFFQVYEPNQVVIIDQWLDNWHGREEAMMEALTAFHGEEPPVALVESQPRTRQPGSKRPGGGAAATATESSIFRLPSPVMYQGRAPSAEGSTPDRERSAQLHQQCKGALQQLFMLYSPELFPTVDDVLRAWGGSSADGDASSSSSHSPTPINNGSPARAPHQKTVSQLPLLLRLLETQLRWRDEVFELLVQKYGKEKLSEGVSLLREWYGCEPQLVQMLRAVPDAAGGNLPGNNSRQGASTVAGGGGAAGGDLTTSPPSSLPQPPTTTILPFGSIRDQVVQIYRCYNPEKLADVDTILKTYEGREETLLRSLHRKYLGQTLGTIPAAAPATTTTAPPGAEVVSTEASVAEVPRSVVPKYVVLPDTAAPVRKPAAAELLRDLEQRVLHPPSSPSSSPALARSATGDARTVSTRVPFGGHAAPYMHLPLMSPVKAVAPPRATPSKGQTTTPSRSIGGSEEHALLLWLQRHQIPMQFPLLAPPAVVATTGATPRRETSQWVALVDVLRREEITLDVLPMLSPIDWSALGVPAHVAQAIHTGMAADGYCS